MPALDAYLGAVPFHTYEGEADTLSRLIDVHFNLLPHSYVDQHLATASSVLASKSESLNAHVHDGVFSLAAKKWVYFLCEQV